MKINGNPSEKVSLGEEHSEQRLQVRPNNDESSKRSKKRKSFSKMKRKKKKRRKKEQKLGEEDERIAQHRRRSEDLISSGGGNNYATAERNCKEVYQREKSRENWRRKVFNCKRKLTISCDEVAVFVDGAASRLHLMRKISHQKSSVHLNIAEAFDGTFPRIHSIEKLLRRILN